MKYPNGTITLGVKDKTYEGLWRARDGKVIFTFADPLPSPYKGMKEVTKEFRLWDKMLPYEMGGQMVNEILAKEK